MSQRRLNDADGLNHGSEVGSVSIAPYEYAAVYDYLGKNRYLQAAFCKSVRQLYSAKFGTYTTKYLSNIAAEEGFISLLEWSKQIGCRWDKGVFVSGAKGGHVDLLKYLKDNNCPMGDQNGMLAWRAAVERGHVEVFKFAYDSSYLVETHRLCALAARTNHLNILKWMYEAAGVTYFNADTCESAAHGGFIDIIKWLRSAGCEWTAKTCLAAISKGHVGVLKWALDNMCPWTLNDRGPNGKTGLHYAGNVEMIEFLISYGANINAQDNQGNTPLHTKILKANLEAVKTLIRLGAVVNIADAVGVTPLDLAVRRRHHQIVEVLRAAGAREST